MQVSDKKFSEFAFDSGLVSKTELSKAQKESIKTGLSLGEILIKEGFIAEDDLRRINANLSGISFVDLKNKNIELETLQIIPEPISRKHNIVAFDRNGSEIEVALLHLEDLSAISFLTKDNHYKFVPRYTDKESIREALISYQKNLKKDFGVKIEKESEKISKSFGTFGDKDSNASDLKKIAEDKSVSHLAELILKHALAQNAVDISLEPQEDETLVRYRIDGILREAFSLPGTVQLPLVARFKYLSGLELGNKLPQDGRFKMETAENISSNKTSFRVNTLPTAFGEKVVLRIIQIGALGFNLETLGFHSDGLDHIHTALRQNSGLVIACGAAGTGKTTTLYTVLDILNKPSTSISTIENPVEYAMKRINQTEVKEEMGLTFLSGLRAIMKQDPDVVMVGNVEEEDVAKLSVSASLSQKLVLISLSSKTPDEAIEKMLKMKVDLLSFASSLKVVTGHMLAKRVSGDGEEYILSEKEISKLNRVADVEKVLEKLKIEKIIPKNSSLEKIKFLKQGELPTEDSIYVGLHEVLNVSHSIKDLILKNSGAEDIRSQALKEGMLSFAEDALFRAIQGQISIDEVFRVSSEV